MSRGEAPAPNGRERRGYLLSYRPTESGLTDDLGDVRSLVLVLRRAWARCGCFGDICYENDRAVVR